MGHFSVCIPLSSFLEPKTSLKPWSNHTHNTDLLNFSIEKRTFAGMDTTLYLSSGKAALALGVSPDSVRRLCASGAIQAELTQGGQWRVPAEEVERLKAEGMPPVPRPLPGQSKRA